jgi:hypothetical protein
LSSNHAERVAGESKYPLYKLIRLNFDLVTGFSLAPLQMFSLAGIALSLASAAFVLFLADSPVGRRPGSGRIVHAVRDQFFPDRHPAVRHRAAGRIHRPDLPAGARTSAFHHPGDSGTA